MYLTDNEKRDAIKLIWGDNKLVLSSRKHGKNKIGVEQGQIVKVSKDKNGIVTREVLTKRWTDWIDYWSVDFDFENEWQSFRTKKDRDLELKTPYHECKSGRYRVAANVVDIFGNDTMKIIEVSV